jgi:hypothetical protein
MPRLTLPMIRYLQIAGLKLRAAAHSVAAHADVPGYRQLPAAARIRLNVLSLACFLGSAACARVFCALGTWLLVTYILIWSHDLRGPAAAALPSSALLWLLPWVAAIRRRQIARLLGGRWEHS